MMAVFVLPVLLLSQMVLANPTYRELMDLADLLKVEKRLKDDDSLYEEECVQDPIDLGLVIDSSVSIAVKDFLTGQKFLGDLLDGYDIGPGRRQVRVSAVTFGRGVYAEDSFNLNSYKSKEEVIQHVKNMEFRYGTRTDTGDAIKYMREKQMRNARPWVRKVAIVLTDGNSQRRDWTREQGDQAKAANITVLAVGVGPTVKSTELKNIAGQVEENVIQADSYDALKKTLDLLANKTCTRVLKPTTTPVPTTTPPMKIVACSELYPSDINFIFSPASLGVDSTSWVTQFISHTINDEELESGFQYGVVSGDCPDDAGFRLNEYSDVGSIRRRLDRYDRNNLPALVRSASSSAFTRTNGGRDEASRVAVIFLGQAKVDQSALNKEIEQLMVSGVQVFVATTDPGVNPSLPRGVRKLEPGSSISQATEFVSRICHLNEIF